MLLFLGAHLRVGIAPGAQLQAAAHPAQTFTRDGSAFLPTDDAARWFLDAIRFDSQAGLLDDGVRSRGFHDGYSRRRRCAFLSHIPTIST